ncbi:hypothetical protein ACFWJM_29970 [Streptomyces sp. NPDC127077]|uniref:hypothetical protein n=1 Tax=Streptomyces sp. NPDC127077 TaxID=3347131 RepID=UPI0036506E79
MNLTLLKPITKIKKSIRASLMLKISEDARRRYSTWIYLKPFLSDGASEADQKREFRGQCVRAAEANIRELHLHTIMNICGAVFFNVATLGPMIFWSIRSDSWILTLTLWLTFLIEYSTISIVAMRKAIALSLSMYTGGGITCLFVATEVYGAVIPGHGANPVAKGVILSTYVNTLVPLGVVTAASAVALITRAVVDSLRLRKYPRVVVFAELQVITKLLGSKRQSLSDARLQNEINERLERAATCLQRGVANSMSISTANGKGVFQLRLDRTAARLREYQLWVALPRTDTRDVLLSEIAQTCADFSVGFYDLLPETDVPALSAREYASTIGKVLRGIVAGIFPLFVLWGVRQFDLLPQGALGSSLTVAAIVWAVVSIVGLIDPLYSGKIAALKDVMSILTRGGK